MGDNLNNARNGRSVSKIQGWKLTLANLQNATAREKISSSKRLRVRIIHVSPKNLERICQWSHQFASGKNPTSKTLQVREKLTLSPEKFQNCQVRSP